MIGDKKCFDTQLILACSNGELAAGLTVLYGRSGPGSLVKIWGIEEKELLHQFRVLGKAHAVAFTPDSSTVVAADRSGKLAGVSTIRAWDLSEGAERKVGTCVSEIGELWFSPVGGQLAFGKSVQTATRIWGEFAHLLPQKLRSSNSIQKCARSCGASKLTASGTHIESTMGTC